MQEIERYGALVSDFDGVILPDSEMVNVMAIIATMHAEGYVLTEKEIEQIPGRPSGDLLSELLAHRRVHSRDYREIVNKNRERYDEIWESHVELDPVVDRTLRELHRRGFQIAIATTNRRSVVEKFLDRFDLRTVIAVIVSGEDVTKKKPDPEVYALASQRFSGKRCLAVEDMPIGVAAARAAGLDCAAIPNRYSYSKDFSGAKYLLKSFGELLPFF